MEKDGESFKMFQSLCYVRCRCRIDSVNASASVMSNSIWKSEVGLSVWKTTEVQAHKTLETKRFRQAASISQHNSNLDRARSNNTGWAWGSLGQVKRVFMDFQLSCKAAAARPEWVSVCPCYFPAALIILASNSSAGRKQLIVFHSNHCALSAGNVPRLSLKLNFHSTIFGHFIELGTTNYN